MRVVFASLMVVMVLAAITFFYTGHDALAAVAGLVAGAPAFGLSFAQPPAAQEERSRGTLRLADSAIFDDASKRLLTAIASQHGFRLDAMSVAETHRLEAFLHHAEKSKYPVLANLDEKIFLAAKLTCLREVEALIANATQVH